MLLNSVRWKIKQNQSNKYVFATSRMSSGVHLGKVAKSTFTFTERPRQSISHLSGVVSFPRPTHRGGFLYNWYSSQSICESLCDFHQLIIESPCPCVCLCVCAIGCSFFRPLIGPVITWSVPGLSLVSLALPTQPSCISPTLRIGRESWCLSYAGFLFN